METYESPRADRPSPDLTPPCGSLTVVCFSTYVREPALRTPRHQDVRHFLLALRGERTIGEARIPVLGQERALTAANLNDSIDWFGEMAVAYLRAKGIRPPFGLVPVPTSRATRESGAAPWTSLLAISIVSNGLEEADVADVLRWKDSARRRGPQTAAELYRNLVVTEPLSPAVPLLLVDYLFTSAAALRACAARLSEQGIHVPLALCAGRTAARADHNPFSALVGELSPFQPGH